MTADPERSEPAATVFRAEPLPAILEHVQRHFADGASQVRIEVLDPDHGRGLFAGERVTIGGVEHVHRPLQVWVDLAARLGLRLLTPRPAAPPRIELRLERLDPSADWHREAAPDPTEKYGAGSSFARISKLEDPDFVLDVADAIDRIGLTADARVLELGVGRGDALALLTARVPGLAGRGELVGVDHSRSALDLARARLPGARFVAADLADLAGLELGRFDLVLAIDTLQSSGLDDRALLRTIVQRCLTPRGAILLSLPNCRYLDGEVLYGARTRNFREPELGLMIRDIAYYQRYLRQHAFATRVTGKYAVLLTATPIARG